MSFDRVADRYDASRGANGWPEVAVAAIAPWLTPGVPVIEVGVGTGLIASRLAARGCSVVGCDVSLRMLEQAQRRLGPRGPHGCSRPAGGWLRSARLGASPQITRTGCWRAFDCG
ncbi:MAG: class I SAM-dependent methyltransferase [Frankiaceae bacterium]